MKREEIIKEAEIKAKIKKMVEDSIPETEKAFSAKWGVFSGYLFSEKQERGNREFRLVVDDNDDFYIHPLGSDGETLNGNLFDPIQQIVKEQPKKKVAFIGEPPLAMRALLEMESEPQQPDTEVEKPDLEEMKKDFAENPEYAAMKYGEEQAVEDKFLFKGEYYFTHSYVKSIQEKHESQKQQWDREIANRLENLNAQWEDPEILNTDYLKGKISILEELLNKYQ